MKYTYIIAGIIICAVGGLFVFTLADRSTELQETDSAETAETGTKGDADKNNEEDVPITFSELAMHNTASSCWVVFRGDVFDLTAWLLQHPGGVQAIAQHCGTTNFEAAFTGQHGDQNVERFYQETTRVGSFVE